MSKQTIPLSIELATGWKALGLIRHEIGIGMTATILSFIMGAMRRGEPFGHLPKPADRCEILSRKQIAPAILLYKALCERMDTADALVLTRKVAIEGARVFLRRMVGILQRETFEQLTAKDPADRPSSAREVEHQLNEIVRGFPSEGSLSDYVDWLEHAAPGDVPPSGSGEYTTPTPGSWSDGGTPAAAVSPESNPPGHSGDVKIAAGGRRNRIWLLALLLLILGALGFGWAMGWYQGRDGVERAHRRALRAEARGQAQVERQARKDAVRSDPDPDPAGPEFGAVEPDDESVTPVGLAVVDPVPPKNEGPAAGGGGAPVTVVAEEALAPLMIQCMPWCDQIQVDGEVWGGSPVLDRSTTVGHHEIRLHSATGAEANVSLEVTADGAKLCWDFELGGACTSP